MKKTPCRVQNLAGDGLCAIEFCHGCKLFHLTIGFTTLRIGPEAFTSLGTTIHTALTRFRSLDQAADEDASSRLAKRKTPFH